MRKERRRAGISLRNVARNMGVSAAYVCDLEHGRRNWSQKLRASFLEAISTAIPLLFAVAVLVAFSYGWERGSKVYYVALTGSDSGPCSEKAPCRTIRKAFSKMRTQDQLVIRKGWVADRDELLTLERSRDSEEAKDAQRVLAATSAR